MKRELRSPSALGTWESRFPGFHCDQRPHSVFKEGSKESPRGPQGRPRRAPEQPRIDPRTAPREPPGVSRRPPKLQKIVLLEPNFKEQALLLEIRKAPPNNFKEQGLLLELWFKEHVFLKFQGSSRSLAMGGRWAGGQVLVLSIFLMRYVGVPKAHATVPRMAIPSFPKPLSPLPPSPPPLAADPPWPPSVLFTRYRFWGTDFLGRCHIYIRRETCLYIYI